MHEYDAEDMLDEIDDAKKRFIEQQQAEEGKPKNKSAPTKALAGPAP